MKQSLLAILLISLLAGCSAQKVDPVTPLPNPAVAATAETQLAAAPASPVAPLPFRVQLAQGDPSELPPVVAASLSNRSPITFTYREELTHDDYHVPRMLSALDPATYVGAPLGDYGVTAFAALTIYDGERVIGDYTAKQRVSKSYNLYKEPTHAEVERAARDAVRQKIDDQLEKDTTRLAQAATGEPITQAGALDR